MSLFKRKPDMESAASLQSLSETLGNKVRRYTRNEVNSIMAMLSGVAVDGAPIYKWEIHEEAKWFNVEVKFSDTEYQNWYFFKPDEEVAP